MSRSVVILAEFLNHRALQLANGIVAMERCNEYGEWRQVAYCSIDNEAMWRGFVEGDR